MIKGKWADRIRNEEVMLRMGGERKLMRIIRKRKSF